MACIDENFLPRIFFSQIFLTMNFSQTTVYCCFHIHHQLMFGYISLHSVSLVPNNSFTMLINILLFQHYSCQICNHNLLLYSQYYASIIGSGLIYSCVCKYRAIYCIIIPTLLWLSQN